MGHIDIYTMAIDDRKNPDANESDVIQFVGDGYIFIWGTVDHMGFSTVKTYYFHQ